MHFVQVFEMPAKHRLFPCLHTFQLIGQFTLLPSVEALLLKRVVLGVEISQHSELNDPLGSRGGFIQTQGQISQTESFLKIFLLASRGCRFHCWRPSLFN